MQLCAEGARKLKNTEGSTVARFRKFSIEFAVIVAGVLLALVAENWWSERDERAYERDLREDMVEEFRENLLILESDVAINQAVVAELHRLAALSDDELMSLPDSAFAPWSQIEMNWAGFDPMMGNTQALVQSGNLGAIADRNLRLRLSIWAGLLEEKTRFTRNAVTFQGLVFTPSAAKFGADGVWSETERREFLSLLRTMRSRVETTIENQIRLIAAAEELVLYIQQEP